MQLYSVCNSVLTLCCCFFFLQYYSSNCSSLHYDYEVGLGQDPFLKFFRENANYSVGGEQKKRECERERGGKIEMDQIGLFESTSQYIAQHINELVEMGSPVLCYLHSTIHIVVPAHMPGCRDENDSGIDGLQQQIEISSSPLNFSIDFQSFQ